MNGTMRLSVIVDGQTREATVKVNEVTQALDRLEGQARQTGAAAAASFQQTGQGAAQAAQLSTQQLAGMQFQLQDMAVGLASGQSPFTVMMQQGSQMAQAFAAGTGPRAALAAVGQGVTQFVTNPLNLMVLGAGVAATAMTTFFSEVVGAANSTQGALEQHADLVKRIKDAYDGTTESVKRYADETRMALMADAIRDRQRLGGAFRDETRGLVTDARAGLMIGGIAVPRGQSGLAGELEDAVQTLRQQIRDGKPDIKAFVDELARIEISAGQDSATGKLAGQIRDANRELLDLATDYEQSNDIVKALQSSAKDLNAALGEGTEKVNSLARAIGGIPDTIGGYGPRSPFAGAPNTMVGKSFLDLLGAAEGTDRGRGYNETLGYGKFTGGPVDLVTMTLAQVIELQSRMLADPQNTFNSSAVGRYQITRETLQDFMPRLGLSPDTIFSADVQDKIALAIANAAGRSVERLQGRWEGLKFVGQGTILSAFDGAGGQRAGVAADIESNRLAEQKIQLKEREHEVTTRIAESIREQQQAERSWLQNTNAMLRASVAFTDQFRGMTDGFVSTIAAARAAGESWTDSLVAGLEGVEQKALSFLDKFIDKALDAALFGQQGTSGGGLLGGLLGSLFGSSNPMQNALGNAFSGGTVIPFATGTVISSPMLFPMSGGQTGLMAEAGPEAIMPLTRAASGHLGVRAIGGGGGGTVVNLNVVNNAGAQVKTQQRQNAGGGIDIDLLIERKIDSHLGREDVTRNLQNRLGLKPTAQAWG